LSWNSALPMKNSARCLFAASSPVSPSITFWISTVTE
jgi:hypothetical protein